MNKLLFVRMGILAEKMAFIQTAKGKLQYFGIMTSSRGNIKFAHFVRSPGGSTYRDYTVYEK